MAGQGAPQGKASGRVPRWLRTAPRTSAEGPTAFRPLCAIATRPLLIVCFSLDTPAAQPQNPAILSRRCSRESLWGYRAVLAGLDGAMHQPAVPGARALAARGRRACRLLQQLRRSAAQRSTAARAAAALAAAPTERLPAIRAPAIARQAAKSGSSPSR